MDEEEAKAIYYRNRALPNRSYDRWGLSWLDEAFVKWFANNPTTTSS